MNQLIVYLLPAVVLLLGYQFLYREYAYRRAAIAERDTFLREIKDEWKKIEKARADKDACSARYGLLSKKCEPLNLEFEKVLRKASGVEDRLNRLHQAVLSRYDGIAPSWWPQNKRE